MGKERTLLHIRAEFARTPLQGARGRVCNLDLAVSPREDSVRGDRRSRLSHLTWSVCLPRRHFSSAAGALRPRRRPSTLRPTLLQLSIRAGGCGCWAPPEGWG